MTLTRVGFKQNHTVDITTWYAWLYSTPQASWPFALSIMLHLQNKKTISYLPRPGVESKHDANVFFIAYIAQYAGPPRPLTSRGTSAWPYRLTTQYSFFPVQIYIVNTTIVKLWNYKSNDLLKNGSPTRAWRRQSSHQLDRRQGVRGLKARAFIS